MNPREERSLVLRQFVALRRAGVSALDALTQLVKALPEGEVRGACKEAVLALQAAPAPHSTDDFVRVLSERSGEPARAELLARAYEAQLEAEAAQRAGTQLAQVVVAAPLLALSAVGWLAGPPKHFLELGAALPAPTDVFLSTAQVLRFVGPPLAVFLVIALARWKGFPVFGARWLRSASGLLVASSTAEPLGALHTTKLEPTERVAVEVLVRRAGPGGGAAVLEGVAAKLARDGRRGVEQFQVLASLALTLFAALGIGSVLTLLYLPVFSIAGAVQ